MLRPVLLLTFGAVLAGCSNSNSSQMAWAPRSSPRPQPIAENLTADAAQTTVISGEVLQQVPEGIFVRSAKRRAGNRDTSQELYFVRRTYAPVGSSVEIQGYEDGTYAYTTTGGTRAELPAVRTVNQL